MGEWLADKAILIGTVVLCLPAVVLTVAPVLV